MVNTRGSPDPLSPPLWYSRVKVLDKIPDWEKSIYFNPEEALRNKREVYTWVDSKGQPWEDTNPMAPSFSEVLEGELSDVTRYVHRRSYQTKCDDKSGYDHVKVQNQSKTLLGFEWGGFYFVCTTIPFGWSLSAWVYNTLGLAATSYVRAVGVPSTHYIDDRHAGQLTRPNQPTEVDEITAFRRAEKAIFLLVTILVRLGYFINLAKSVLVPTQIITFLGMIINSILMAFGIPEEKKGKFGTLRRQILSEGKVDVKLLQKLVGKIISFAVAVPGTQLFTRECNLAISQAVRKGQMIYIRGDLRKEIEHWEFLESWQGSFPWRQERHLTIKLASDASNARWGGVIDPGMDSQLVLGDAWSQRERALHINIKEALAVRYVMEAAGDRCRNARVQLQVDNQAVMHAWKAQGRKSKQMFDVLKEIFSLTLRMNCALSMSYVRSADNPADMPSRSFSEVDMALTEDAWETLELKLGPHGIDCMAMPSNARLHNFIAPFPTRQARAVDFFAQTFGKELAKYGKGYVFPPVALVGQVFNHIKQCQYPCTLVAPCTSPVRYWWPILKATASKRVLVGRRGQAGIVKMPSPVGWSPHCLEWDLWAWEIRW
ncbi:hypothetical protein Bbelb_346710 [Branchiostoma belcheri]|nr:hypothetical protein Bbelb_346710 [Branchiostoma belcheri]